MYTKVKSCEELFKEFCTTQVSCLHCRAKRYCPQYKQYRQDGIKVHK